MHTLLDSTELLEHEVVCLVRQISFRFFRMILPLIVALIVCLRLRKVKFTSNADIDFDRVRIVLFAFSRKLLDPNKHSPEQFDKVVLSFAEGLSNNICDCKTEAKKGRPR